MNVSTKILLGFGIIGVLSIIISLDGLNSSSEIQNELPDPSDFQKYSNAAIESSSYAKRAEGHLMLYFSLNSEEDREKFFLRHASIQDQINILRNIQDENILGYLDSLQDATNIMLATGERLLLMYDLDDGKLDLEENEELLLEFHQSAANARNDGVKIAEIIIENSAQSLLKFSAYTEKIFSNLLLGSLILILVIIGVAIWIVKAVKKAIPSEKNL